MPSGRDCPNCRKPAPESSAECPACGLIFAKWESRQGALTPAAARESAGSPAEISFPWMWSVGAATVVALAAASQFRNHLPMSETMAAVRSKWLLLELFTSVLYVGEQVILAFTGDNIFFFSVVAGTEWAALLALMRHFWLQGSRAGIFFITFWMGTNLFTESFFVADAKTRYLMAALEEAGAAGPGGRDWSQKLHSLGLLDWCVGLGQLEFFTACWLMTFALLAGGWTAYATIPCSRG